MCPAKTDDKTSSLDNEKSIPVNGYRTKKFQRNLENKDVRRWYDSMAKKSPQCAGVYFRSLSRFCDLLNTTPWDFAKLPRRKMENIVMDFVSEMESKKNPKTGRGYSPKYIEKYTDATKSWAEWSGKKFQRKMVVGETDFEPISMTERVPTTEELRMLLYASTTPLRTRVIASHMSQGGFRPMSFGDFHGTDGLRIKDFVGLKITTNADGKQEVRFDTLPSEVIVRKNLSKIRKEYRTEESEEAGEILLEWLNSRIRSGEVLSPESGIVVTTEADRKRLRVPQEKLGVKDHSPFLCSGKVSGLVKDAMVEVGMPWRPYVLRSYFDTVLTTAEQKGWMSHSIQQFVMGHQGDIERTYSLNKMKLPDHLVEEIRAAYRKCQELLQTRTSKADVMTEEKTKNLLKVSLFVALGFSEEEIQREKLLEKKEEEIQAIVRKKILSAAKDVDEDEVYAKPEEANQLKGGGYRWVGNLPDGRIVMRR